MADNNGEMKTSPQCEASHRSLAKLPMNPALWWHLGTALASHVQHSIKRQCLNLRARLTAVFCSIRGNHSQSRNDLIDKDIQYDAQRRTREAITILLGMSRAGKRTLRQAMKIHVNGNIDEDERREYIYSIWTTLLNATCRVLDRLITQDLPLDNSENLQYIKMILQVRDTSPMDLQQLREPTMVTALKSLWGDAGFRSGYTSTHEEYPDDNTAFFAQSIDRLAHPQYLPTNEDILRSSHRRSSGPTEMSLDSDDIALRMIHLGGANTERRKWIHQFEDASFVVFFVDAYDLVFDYADCLNKDRLKQILELFESILTSRWFAKSNFLLLLTKIDRVKDVLSADPSEFACSLKRSAERSVLNCFPELLTSPEGVDRSTIASRYLQRLEEQFMTAWQRHRRPNSQIRTVQADLVTLDSASSVRNVFDAILDMRRMAEEQHRPNP